VKNFKNHPFGASLVAATVSAMFGIILWWCFDGLLPFIFVLSPFLLVMSQPISLPILYCWRYFGDKSALWAAVLSALFLFVAIPSAFAFVLMLQLLAPAAFLAVIADRRTQTAVASRGGFIPLPILVSSTSLFLAATSIVLTAFLMNTPDIAAFFDRSISEMTRMLTLMGTLPPNQIIQFDMLLRFDHHVLIIRMFVLYSFVATWLNFYIASRSGKNRAGLASRRRDFWPYDASSLPRLQLILLVAAVILVRFPIDATLQHCLDIISMMLMLSFTLSGLAAIHLITRGKSWRPFLLTALYIGLLPLFASFILILWGIFISTTPLLQRYKNNLDPS